MSVVRKINWNVFNATLLMLMQDTMVYAHMLDIEESVSRQQCDCHERCLVGRYGG